MSVTTLLCTCPVSLERLWCGELLKLCQVRGRLTYSLMWLLADGRLLGRRRGQLLKLILEQTQLLQQRRSIQRQAW